MCAAKTVTANDRVVLEAFQDLVDPLEYLHDTPGWRSHWSTSSLYADRKAGELGPIIQNEDDLRRLRGLARAVADVSVYAKAALQNLENYVIGKGLTYSVALKRGVKTSIGEETLDHVKWIINEFLTRTKWGTAKRRKNILRRTRRDGEMLAAIFPMSDGRCNVRILEPGLLRAPIAPERRAAELSIMDGDWSFGVHTDQDDPETIYGYHIQWSDKADDYTYFRPDRFHHVKRNVDDDVKRGLTDFYPVERYLVHAGKLLSNTVQGGSILSAITAIIQHPEGTTSGQAENLAVGNRYTYRDENTPQGQRTKQIHKYNPGTFMHIPKGAEYKGFPLAERGAGDSLVVINQAVLRAVGTNWAMPEYMISGDASNNNYASILEAGTPFVLFVTGVQGECAEEDAELLWKILRVAHRARLLGNVDFEELKEAVEIQIEAPQVARTLTSDETARRKTLNEAGILSEKTWAAQEDLDFDVEKENGATVKQTFQPYMGTAPSDTITQSNTTTDNTPDHTVDPAVAQAPKDTDTPQTSSGSVVNPEAGLQTELTLNGAQVTAALELLTQMASGNIAREAAIELLVGIGIPQERAQVMINAQANVVPKQETPPVQDFKQDELSIKARESWAKYPS